MAGPEPPQAVLNSLQLLQEPRAVLNLVRPVLNSMQHLQEPRAVLDSLLSLDAQVNDLWTASVLHSLAYPPSGSDTPARATRETPTILSVLHSPARRRSSNGLQPLSLQGSAGCREMSTPTRVPHNPVQQQQQQQQQQQYHHLHLQHEPDTFNAASFSMARAPMILQSYVEPCSKRRRSSDDSNARRLQTTTAAKHSRSCLHRRISCNAYLPNKGHSNHQRSVPSTSYIVAHFS